MIPVVVGAEPEAVIRIWPDTWTTEERRALDACAAVIAGAIGMAQREHERQETNPGCDRTWTTSPSSRTSNTRTTITPWATPWSTSALRSKPSSAIPLVNGSPTKT